MAYTEPTNQVHTDHAPVLHHSHYSHTTAHTADMAYTAVSQWSGSGSSHALVWLDMDKWGLLESRTAVHYTRVLRKCHLGHVYVCCTLQTHVLELLIIVVAIADALILSNGVIIGAL